MSTELIRADLLRSASRASAAPLIAGTAIRTFAATAGVRGRTGPLTAELSAAEADRLALARATVVRVRFEPATTRLIARR